MHSFYLRLLSILVVSLCLINCFNPDDYDTPTVSQAQIRFEPYDGTHVLADGKSTAELRVAISPKTAVSKRTVVFTTDNGFFVGGKGDSLVVSNIENFTALAKLSSVTVGEATVKAKIQGLKAINDQKVTFDKANPSAISVAVDSFAVSGNYVAETVLVASLKTSTGGVPSSGHPVSFSVSQSNLSVGVFLNNQSTAFTGSDGKARIRYSPGSTATRGLATVTAATSTTLNVSEVKSLTATTQIYVRIP